MSSACWLAGQGAIEAGAGACGSSSSSRRAGSRRGAGAAGRGGRLGRPAGEGSGLGHGAVRLGRPDGRAAPGAWSARSWGSGSARWPTPTSSTAWLAETSASRERQAQRVREALLATLSEEQIEQPTRIRIRRMIGSALRQSEEALTAEVSSRVDDEVTARMLGDDRSRGRRPRRPGQRIRRRLGRAPGRWRGRRCWRRSGRSRQRQPEDHRARRAAQARLDTRRRAPAACSPISRRRSWRAGGPGWRWRHRATCAMTTRRWPGGR